MELLEEKFCRRFDRAVSQASVGRQHLATGADEPKFFKLNEHGPALNVFWSRRSGMGEAAESMTSRPGRKQVKANHAPKKRPTKALDEAGPQGYSDGAYKTSRRGVALAPALSVQYE